MGGRYYHRPDADQERTKANMKRLQKINIGKKIGVFLFLDFDGTLSQIVSHPKYAVIRLDAKKWLKKLLKRRNVKIAIVTGRSLPDIRRRIRLPGLYYVANHGMEVLYKDRFLLKKGRRFERPLKSFGDEMISTLAHIPGIFIEEKGLSVAVHFRQVERKYYSLVKKIVHDVAGPMVKKYDLQITEGKMILELRPAAVWNKGNAVKWLWRKIAQAYFPVYVGDDITDEDAFEALKDHGLTIRVGKKTGSHAQYYISSIRTLIKSDLLKDVE